MRSLLHSLVLLPLLTTPLPAQRLLQDQSELNLVASIRQETDEAHRLLLLREWEGKYPESQFRQERYNLILTAEQALGKPQEMLRTAIAMVRDDPEGLGQYWLTALAVTLQDTSELALARGERAARSLLHNLPEMYSPDKKPGAITSEAWIQNQRRNEAVAHRTLGWVAYSRHQWTTAEQELTRTLRANPNDAEASFWLGASILSQNVPATRASGLYHLARSLVVTGPGALTPAAQSLVRPYLEKGYSEQTGNANSASLDRLLTQAKRSVFPPADFGL